MRVYQSTIFLAVLYFTTASHFRGATIQWKPVNPFNGSVIIAYQISWRRSSEPCDNSTIASGIYSGEGYLYCRVGCTNGYVGNMLYRCTAFSELADWSYGRNEYLYNASGVSYFELQFSSCCWLSTLQIGRDGSYSLIVRGNLTVRRDTGNINSSPVVTMPPVVNVPSGCISQIRLDVRDPDGDVVRCRWATSNQSECGGVCNAFPSCTLTPDTCVLTYLGAQSTGQFVVAIQVEDFARSTDIIPLSSVPLQFVVNVVSPYVASASCTYLPPIFIPPTPLNGTCNPVLWGQMWTLAQSQFYLSSVISVFVTGATSHVVMKNDTHLSVGIATDNIGASSVKKCVTLLVVKKTSEIEINVLSSNVVQINWTYTKPASLGFNVSVYEVTSNSANVRVVKTNLIDSCSQSTQFNGLDGGIPYRVIINGMNERNEISESILSSTFFLSQKVPIGPPPGVAKIVLSEYIILLTWSQPTLMNARGFVIGYSLIYSCAMSYSTELKLFEVTEEYFYLRTVNDSIATCSVAVCTRTIAGCGPLSEPVIVQESAAGLLSNTTVSGLQSQLHTYMVVIYALSSIILVGILVAVAISIVQYVRRSAKTTSMSSRTEIEMVECDAYATRKEIRNDFHYELNN